ncbi:MAG: copper amine oxidase N-terminal domain-containing protein [Clostridia bacterium]|nr:copper amine oxidase N-terminal domain-containing protein [Clostridia bacterium]
MYTLLTYPVIKDSRTFIPLRFVSEQLGYNVEWIGETQTIKITAPEE